MATQSYLPQSGPGNGPSFGKKSNDSQSSTMTGPHRPQDKDKDSDDMPQFGATFYPGGVDDFYMPEVVAPAPQRFMPEVPHNMQQGLQRLELEARSVEPNHPNMQSSRVSSSGGAPQLPAVNTGFGNFGHQYQQQQQQQQPPPPPQNNYSPASNYSPSGFSASTEPPSNRDRGGTRDMRDLPSFSPFPKVQGDHIPPSDDEKEAVLAESRQHVLHSNDPNMQICWARDVLAYVEISAEAAIREAEAARRYGDPEPTTRPATPKIEHELRLDAINIVSYLADQGHPEATFIRSKWLEFGKFGRRQDKKEAYSGYTLAAQQGWGRADYRIGMLYENSNDMESAMRHYNMGLSTNDSAASYRLGMINLMGQRNQPKDLNRGLELIHSAADTADEDAPQGAFVYGMLIARDLPDVTIPEGILPYDVTIARQYVEKAAYLGFAKAQLKMGQAYELCQLGCDFNPALSLHYYGLAARQGQPEACLGVSRWFLFGYEGTFAKNEQLAFKYAQLAAKSKLPTGEFAMGYYYEIGISVEKDLREARRWYELAAEHGNKDAVARLDGMSQSKTLSKEDHETTAMTRIKSKYGSQKGQRPERFRQPVHNNNNAMPTLAEDRQPSPRVSPHPSPRGPNFDRTDFPDPSRNGNAGDGRAPAFTVNLAERPKSAAPYPEDDRPPPLNVRPKSTTPYPDDDLMGAKPQPRYNPNVRPSSGSGTDHAGGAFGIRNQSAGYGPQPGGMRPSQSTGQLAIPPAGTDPSRIRPTPTNWQPQVPAAGYRQPSPGPNRQDIRPGAAQYDQRPPQSGYDHRLPSGGGPGGPAKPGQSRLTKPNPNPGLPGQYPPGGGNGYGQRESSLPAHPQPGRDYAPGPRGSPRPASDRYDSYGGGGRAPSAGPQNMGGPLTMSGGMGMGGAPRTDSVGLPQGGPGGQRIGSGGRPGIPLKDRPTPLEGQGQGRSSAPPAQMRPQIASPTPSVHTPSAAEPAPAKPKPKPSQGPATFEQMGIPTVKKEDDCVVM